MKFTEETDAKLIEIVNRIVNANPVMALQCVNTIWLAANLKDGDVLEDVLKEYYYQDMVRRMKNMEEPSL